MMVDFVVGWLVAVRVVGFVPVGFVLEWNSNNGCIVWFGWTWLMLINGWS